MSCRAVEVEFAAVAPNVVGVNGKALPPEPQAVPVLEIVPLIEKVAQPAAPPADETIKFVVEAVPETVNAVEEANRKVEATVPVAVNMFATTPLAPTTESTA